jgi:hypothetical protein
VKSAKDLKREMNEAYAARFARRSKERRKVERARRVEARELGWLSAYNAAAEKSGVTGIQLPAPRQHGPTRRRGRRRA